MARGYNLHANGIRQHLLHYAGDGPQMLLIPGITSPAITWGFIAERLAEKFDVHVLDVRGRGLSEAGDLDYSLDAMAKDALAVIDGAGLDKPIILGHSMGARNAIRAARMNGDAMSGLILVDPPVSGPGRREYPSQWAWYEESIIAATKGCSGDDMRAFCPTWTDDQVALRAEWLHTCQLGAIRTTYDGFHTDDIHADLPHIKLPMRLLKAGDAPVIGEDDITEIKTLAPDIDVKIVQGAGHMIPWDNLDGFLDAVMDFNASA
ncbi:alpha/beta hydrolase superfamily protein [Octadecabacter arcticus 238]|jgi:N-formylmaleamate deformylase|uniref:Alpha/beta hydrolase superfamily protein n=1 Tax=Octadecabacter arcticus 238 TaxID=391616 RepID=M9RKW4_9RHOB|nr:alpha/beta hydrolase [Octadecabacter arcticus]AGI71031.1 alpha/beta hydrolase superfamily protein [Octadecabacter arcticus 238]